MGLFFTGLVLFFGMHFMSVFALPLRNSMAERNEKAWKGIYGLVSLAGLVLISMGYADLRQAPTILYVTPGWTRHLAALLLLPTFVFFLASLFPGFVPSPGGSQGNLCLGADIGRFNTQVQQSGAGGSFGIDVDLANIPTNPSQPVLSGQSWHFQGWYRDNNPGPTSNFTDSVEVTFQ